jgi:3-phenylpropionate/trans-cinnamate dioxygenase ferredoxin subunit
MKYLFAARASDVPAGTLTAVDLEGFELMLANFGGAYYALDRRCTHMGENLCDGSLEGSIVTCPRHGARFDVVTGAAVGKAKLLFMRTLPKNLGLHPVKVEGDEILIGLGAAPAATP